MGSSAIRRALLGTLGAFAIASAVAVAAPTPALADPVAEEPLYYLEDPDTGEALFSTDRNERNVLVERGWNYVKVSMYMPTESSHPVYRMFNPVTGEHLFTQDRNEYEYQAAHNGWSQEDVAFYADDSESTPMYRIYNPSLGGTPGSHQFSTDRSWALSRTAYGWDFESVSWYGLRLPDGNAERYQGRWYGGIYWNDIDSTDASNSQVTTPGASEAPVQPGEGRQDVLEYARQWIGWPYVSCGESPDEGGFDCSGLTQWVFSHFGVELPRTTWDQIDWLKANGRWTSDVSQLKPGDLIAMSGGGHVAIFAGKDPVTGRYMMIDAPKPGDSVIEREIYSIYWDGSFMGGGSVL